MSRLAKVRRMLPPLLQSPGIYVIEDTQTAYWPCFGGGMNDPNSSTAFCKALTDGLNHVEFPVENYVPTYYDRNITEIAFFHNLIVIRKEPYGEKASSPELIAKEIAGMQAT